MVAVQLTQHVEVNGLHEQFQSAYKTGHITEKHTFTTTFFAELTASVLFLYFSIYQLHFGTAVHAILLDRRNMISGARRCHGYVRTYQIVTS